MRIGEAARTAGLTPRALRYYEQQGLVTPGRTASGHRDYDGRDVHRLHAVRRLLRAGLTIADVRGVVHVLDPCDHTAAKAATQAAHTPTDHAPTGGEPTDCEVADVTRRRLAELDACIAELVLRRDRLASELTDRFDALFSPPTPGRP